MEHTGELVHHTRSEIANQYASQKIVRKWIDHPESPSSQVIPVLHRELMQGVGAYQKKGLVPLEPGSYRLTHVDLDGKPNNFLVAATDVEPVMQQYTRDLDALLHKELLSPKDRLQETIADAAWAYYTFARIHPFLDGNGRMGRMIVKRIISGRGYKDIIYDSEETEGRDKHLQAMSAVDNWGNISNLELYFLEQLHMRYTGDAGMQQQLAEIMVQKRADIASQKEKRDLTGIWSGFKDLHLDGVAARDYAQSSYAETV